MTAAALSSELKSILTRAGVGNPAGDAVLILEEVTGLTHAMQVLHRDDEIPPDRCARAAAMARRRAQGEPIQYVLGKWCFMGGAYAVGEGVLIPRDDTEVVVRAALEQIRQTPSPTVVDLCAGSGIIAVTAKRERPDAVVSAVEKSPAAFAYLEHNAALNRTDIRLICADLCTCFDAFADGSIDLVVSNPPYIRADEIDTLQREIAYEPRMALDGGESGYDFYDRILRLWTPKLRTGGVIALELGEGQFGTVSDRLTAHGYADVRGYADIQGITRAVTAKKQAAL